MDERERRVEKEGKKTWDKHYVGSVYNRFVPEI